MEYVLAKDHKIYRKHLDSGNYITYPMRVGNFTWIPQKDLVAIRISEDLLDFVEPEDIVIEKNGVGILVSKITATGFESSDGLLIERKNIKTFLKKNGPIDYIKII